MPSRLTFVSIVFEAEFAFALLQARSFALYVAADAVEEILVVDNSSRGMPPDIRISLMDAFGALMDKVKILRPDEICVIPASIGWRSQQVLKLAVASRVKTDLYVTLDAKNHFVGPIMDGFFQSSDGRPRITAYSYLKHPLRPALEKVLDYWGIDPTPHLDHFPATVTPFVLNRSIVLDLIESVEKRSQRSFPQEFVQKELTEFFLYSGYILASGRQLSEVSDIHAQTCPTVWPKSANPTGVRAAIARADQEDLPIFSVHRKAFGLLDDTSLQVLSAFWTRRGLFSDAKSASEFATTFRSRVRTQERRRRIREARHRVPSKLRALMRSLGRN